MDPEREEEESFRTTQRAWRMHRVSEGMKAYRERFGQLPGYLEQDFFIDPRLLENRSAEKQKEDYEYLLMEWEKTMLDFGTQSLNTRIRTINSTRHYD